VKLLNKTANQDYVLVSASDKDKEKVVGFYQHYPVPGYELASVELIFNAGMNREFELYLSRLQNRDQNPAFAPRWPQEEKDPEKKAWRGTINALFENMARPYADPDYPAVKLLPMWHGTKPEILDSIFRTGYANLATTDSGFFGKGIYSAYEAEYPYRVYSQGGLIVNWMAVFSAYPVIDGDMDMLQGKGNYANYDAHFIPVEGKKDGVNYFPTKPNQKHTYTELVVFQSAACLPRYLVKLQESLQKPLSKREKVPETSGEGKIGERDSDYRTGRRFLSSGKYQKAVEHFEKSAEKGYPPACLVLGFLYQHSDLIGKNEPQKSTAYYQKVISQIAWFQKEAQSGLADAQNGLGFCYFHGIGVKKDSKEAVKYYQLAAAQEDIAALNNLALCYENGDGIEKNLAKAAECHQRAANKKDINGQFNFALCCKKGEGVAQDDRKAFQYFKLAADQGDAMAQYFTGVCLSKAEGTPQNLKRAVKYFEMAVNQNNPVAKKTLSTLLQEHPELKTSMENPALLFSPQNSPNLKKGSVYQDTPDEKHKCLMQ
jgi:TPR repeat protein